MDKNGKQGPLTDIKVVEITEGQQGPVAAQLMADMGAEVIKVEPPVTGERGRTLSAVGKITPLVAYFEMNNRGKKSMTVDIRQDKGREIIHKLVKKADFFVWNFRPGVAERRGLAYEDLSRINPRIIYLCVTGWGLKGPHAKAPGLDAVGQAIGGIASVCGEEKDRLLIPKVAIADQTGAFLTCLGGMMALHHRDRTGEGQMVDSSLIGGIIALTGWGMQDYLFTGQMQRRVRSRIKAGGNPILASCFKAKDGKSFLFQLVSWPKWQNGFKALGIENMLADPRFDTPEKIDKNSDEFHVILDKVFLTKTRDEWLKILQDADVVSAPINDFAEASVYPDVVANEYITEIEHPKVGRMRVVGMPLKFSKTPGKIGVASALGEHNDEILKQLGYSAAEIAQLRKDVVI